MPEITLRAMAQVFRRAADTAGQQKAIERTLPLLTPIAEAGVRDCFDRQQNIRGENWPPLKHPRPGESDIGRALLDKGLLRASVAGVAEGSSITLKTNRIGARLQNFGGVVVPVNAQYLCIPATVEAKLAGSPRDFPGLLTPLINKAKTGGVLIGTAGSDAKPKSIELTELPVQYYMTKRVEIPARTFMGYPIYVVNAIMAECGMAVLNWIAFGE